MRHLPMVLTPRARAVVSQAICEVCRHRKWQLLEVNVRTNHVHVVVSAPKDPERVMNDFKVWATRALRNAGECAPEAKPWGHHGSTRYLWDEAALVDASAYVREYQDRPCDGEE